MAFTSKQDRNGADIAVPTANSAMPGPDATGLIRGLQAQSERVGNARSGQTLGAIFVTPFGPDSSGLNFGGGGDMWDWDSGIAVAEQPGEH